MSKRAKINKITVEVEYSDGTQKLVDIDPTESEALFWSDRAVSEILAPFYSTPKDVPDDEKGEVAIDAGYEADVITPDVVMSMWNSPNSIDKADADYPAMIKKKIKCIPTPSPCRYGCWVKN